MEEHTLARLDLLGSVLTVIAALVLVFSMLAAFLITAVAEVPGFEQVARQGRQLASLGAFVAGLVASGVLAGLGGVLKLLVAEQRERSGPSAAD